LAFVWKVQADFAGAKAQEFLAGGRRHKCLLHPVVDEELCKG
jgi:hypothetical protein